MVMTRRDMGRDETDVKHYLFCSRVKRGWVGGAGQASKVRWDKMCVLLSNFWQGEGGWVGQGKQASYLIS
jgi:hypothetical protein